jgi:flagellar hook-associated protein 2
MSSTGALQTITGLASGIDTNAIVSAMMTIAALPQTALKNQVTVETARQNAYSSVLSELKDLTTSYQALTDVGTWASTQAVGSSDSSVTATRTAGAAAGSYTVKVQQLARANQYSTPANGPTSASGAGNIQFTVGGNTTSVAVSAGDSLDTIAAKINQTTASPVYATMFNGQLVVSNKQTGVANAVTVTADASTGLGFSQTQSALDASYSIDNGPVTTTASNTVTTALPGVTLTLNAVNTTGATVTIGQPAPDTANITQKLTDFVNEYNKVVTDIQDRLSEQPVSSPKTDADRAKGVLYNDQGLQRLLGQLRNAFSDTITSTTSPVSPYSSLAQVGLSTGAAVGTGSLSDSSINGMLSVDSTKFASALNSNFDQVKALFTNATGSYSTEGLGQRLQGILKPFTDDALLGGYLSTEVQNEGTRINDLNSQIADWTTRLALKQQTLQAQFTAMETALSQTQATSSALSQQVSQLG